MPNTMRVAQVSRATGPFELVERPIPQPPADWVRIKVQACGICHSDSLVQEGLWPGLQYPRVPGHEVIGVIDALGLGNNGTLIVIGAAESLQVSPLLLLMGRREIKGWYSGNAVDSQDTLAFSALSGVRSMNEVYPLEKVSEAYERMGSGKARFRVVLAMVS